MGNLKVINGKGALMFLWPYDASSRTSIVIVTNDLTVTRFHTLLTHLATFARRVEHIATRHKNMSAQILCWRDVSQGLLTLSQTT